MHRNVTILIAILAVLTVLMGFLWIRGKFFVSSILPTESLPQTVISPTPTLEVSPNIATISGTQASPAAKLVKPASASGKNIVE